ncbi:hypothetical protein [Nonomuraea insulae]|uniref:Asp23/Gls24 family envelope stress response protein n=1 Tax=Nonomuraea insulae TaxID=1616787 RepID=A0ABW1CYG3_9ACTN
MTAGGPDSARAEAGSSAGSGAGAEIGSSADAGSSAETTAGAEARSSAEPSAGAEARSSAGSGAGVDGAVSEALAIAERARACAGVAGLSGGRFGTVATYLPGERLTGVSTDAREVEIAIVATLDRPLPETAEEVRRAVAGLAGDRPVNVRIDDIIVEGS